MGTEARSIINKQQERLTLYDKEGGLREKMKAIKKAVRAQYGSRSSEYTTVRSIRL